MSTSALPVVAIHYSDRIRSPRATIELMRPHLPGLGISRLARQTGLDRIGIPCFAAIRPNAASLATNQGKGVEDDDALASAVMEATEFAIAESPRVPIQRGTSRDLLLHGYRVHIPRRLMPPGEQWHDDLELPWIKGYMLDTGELVLVPLDAVVIGTDVPAHSPIARSTNGLASGNCRDEAVFHALCELIERDAATLWSFRDDAAISERQIDPCDFGDPVIDYLEARIRAADLQLALFDQTTDLGVPVISAHIFEPEERSIVHFDHAEGCGCHPIPARAAIRAITEAAQTRITNIAGARDDFAPSDYRKQLHSGSHIFRGNNETSRAAPPEGCPIGTQLPTLSAFVSQNLALGDINTIIVVPLGGEEFGVSVVKVLAPDLEDRAPNANWHPGTRVFRHLGLLS